MLYSLIIYEIVNFSFFTLYSLLLLSFFLYLKSVPIYVIVHACKHVHVYTKIFNPPPQFSRLGIQVSLAIYICLSGLWLGGLPYLSVLSVFLKLGC